MGHGGGSGLAIGGFGRGGVNGAWTHAASNGRASFASVGFHGHGFDHHGFGRDPGFGHDHDFGHDHGLGHDHDFDRQHHFHDQVAGWWGWPTWGWDCSYANGGCGGEDRASDDYGYSDPPAAPPCGGWVSRSGRYVWSTAPCGPGEGDASVQHVSMSENECSDWVWRANLHRSVCRRPARAAG
jgi:hypothetical protein